MEFVRPKVAPRANPRTDSPARLSGSRGPRREDAATRRRHLVPPFLRLPRPFRVHDLVSMRNLITLVAGLGGAASLAFLALGTSAPAVADPTPSPAAVTYGVDLGHSNIMFKCKHLGVAYQWGRFDEFTGSFTLDADSSKSKVEITVDAASVNSKDEKRDQHLRSADFFDAKQFPEMTFVSTKVVAKEGDVFTITGDLTLHGVKKSITFDVTKVGEAATRMGDRAGFEGSFVIDRMDYGVSAYGEMLGHEVTMTFAIEGVKR